MASCQRIDYARPNHQRRLARLDSGFEFDARVRADPGSELDGVWPAVGGKEIAAEGAGVGRAAAAEQDHAGASGEPRCQLVRLLLPALPAAFDHRGLGRRFASQIETAAFRIIQEALTNVARHARVSEAAVRIWVEDGLLGMQIEDLGAGCDVQAALSRRNSTGLSGMQEQAELLGGLFTIESAPGEGTLITVELPLSESLEGVR